MGQDEDDQGREGHEPHRRLPQGAAEEGAQAGEFLLSNPRVRIMLSPRARGSGSVWGGGSGIWPWAEARCDVPHASLTAMRLVI